MVKATLTTVTVEGTDTEVKNVLVAIMDRIPEQKGEAQAEQVPGEQVRTESIDAMSAEEIALGAEVHYQYSGIAIPAKKCLLLMALNPGGVTVRQLQTKLGSTIVGSMSGVLSSVGSARRRSPMHLHLYTSRYTNGGLTYFMSPEIAKLIRKEAEADPHLDGWDTSLT